MKIIQNIKVPTGNILIVEGDKGKLEMLSLGDYGRERNVKADFLGLEREIDKVEHSELLQLEEKWVITISTQYSCHSGCRFCDVPKVHCTHKNINATFEDLINQLKTGVALHPEVSYCKHLNVHFARMGEPSWNSAVIDSARHFRLMFPDFKIHPVVSTMMPKKNVLLAQFINEWMETKNNYYDGNAGLQLSINSTNEREREHMFRGSALSLFEIANIMRFHKPRGRKITLNFAVANYEIDPDVLLHYFDPADYIIKLTPMHLTNAALKNNIKTDGDYTTLAPYKHYEEALKKAGYDVLVFIASKEEDLGRITCGNAILSGTMPETDYQLIN